MDKTNVFVITTILQQQLKVYYDRKNQVVTNNIVASGNENVTSKISMYGNITHIQCSQ